MLSEWKRSKWYSANTAPILSRFPTEKQFVSHVTLAPHVPTSGGKPLKKKKRNSASTRVAAALRMAALSLRHSQTALGAYYRKIAQRLGGDVAVFATAQEVGHADLPAAALGPALCGRRRRGLRKPLSPAAHQTLDGHSQTTRLSTDRHKRLRSPLNKSRKVTGQGRTLSGHKSLALRAPTYFPEPPIPSD